MNINYAQAERITSAAKRKAEELNVPVTIVVLDSGGHPIMLSRLDGAFLGTVDIARKKAKTAVLFPFETQDLGPLARAGGPLEGIELTNGILIGFAGGIPLRGPRGESIGSIGVSGGDNDQDHLIAQAGASALLP